MFSFTDNWEWDYDQGTSTSSTHQSGENVPRTQTVVHSEESAEPQEEEQLANPSEYYTHDDPTLGITQTLAGASIRSHSSDHRSSEEYRDPQKGDANQLRYSSSQVGTSSGQHYIPVSQASTSIYGGYSASQASPSIYGGYVASQPTQIQGYGYSQQHITAGVHGAGPSSYGSNSGSSSVPPAQDNTMRKIRTRNPKRNHDELDKSITAVFQLPMELLIIDRI
jgi:hypothetical protein